MPAHVTAKDLVFTCTGRGTHDKAETTVTVWPVTAGHPAGQARSKVPPMLRGTHLRMPDHMEVACPECGRTLRLGWRLQNHVMTAAQEGITDVDISFAPF